METKTNIIIIGGGVVGLMTARALVKRGQRPTVIDRHHCPHEASWCAAGLLMHFPPWLDDAGGVSTAMLEHGWQSYRDLDQELKAIDYDGDLGLHLDGCYLDFKNCDQRLRAWGTQQPSRDNNRSRFPAPLRDCLADAGDWLKLPRYGGQIRPPRLLKALRHWLSRHQVTLGAESVDQINQLNRGYEVLSHDQHARHIRRTQQVVICAGAWSDRLWPDPDRPQVVPVGGHLLRYFFPPADRRSFILGNGHGHYLISRGDGNVLVGSNRQHRGYDKNPDPQIVARLSQVATGFIPQLTDYQPEQVWVGLRPETDRHPWPLLRRLRPTDRSKYGCYLHTAHGHSGIAFAPATAEVLAEFITSGEPPTGLPSFDQLSRRLVAA